MQEEAKNERAARYTTLCLRDVIMWLTAIESRYDCCLSMHDCRIYEHS